jgi:YfiH family protein
VFGWRERISGTAGDAVSLAITDRHGGVSAEPYGSLNLGGHVGDDATAVEENRRRLADTIGLPRERVLFMRQVHGADVSVVDGPWAGEPPEVDALVTRERGLALAVLVADCTPVLLAAPDEGVVGVAHAGRPGLGAGVVLELVTAMRAAGARTIVGRVGPSICGRCYEVPLSMREDIAERVPESRTVDVRGRPALDVAGGVMAQLAPHCAELVWVPGCSRERDDLYSYRRDRITGRYAGLVWIEP